MVNWQIVTNRYITKLHGLKAMQEKKKTKKIGKKNLEKRRNYDTLGFFFFLAGTEGQLYKHVSEVLLSLLCVHSIVTRRFVIEKKIKNKKKTCLDLSYSFSSSLYSRWWRRQRDKFHFRVHVIYTHPPDLFIIFFFFFGK